MESYFVKAAPAVQGTLDAVDRRARPSTSAEKSQHVEKCATQIMTDCSELEGQME